MTTLERAIEEIESYAQARLSRVGMPGLALAITDRERTLRVGTYGHSDITSCRPVQPERELSDMKVISSLFSPLFYFKFAKL